MDSSHVEDADRAEGTRVPLFFVALHGRRHGISEFSDERNSPFGAWEMTLLVTIDGLFEDEEGSDEGGSGT